MGPGAELLGKAIEPLGQQARKKQSVVWLGLDTFDERFLGYLDQFSRHLRNDRGTPRLLQQKRHFADEQVRGGHHRKLAAIDLHREFPFGDVIEKRALLALPEHDLSGLECDHVAATESERQRISDVVRGLVDAKDPDTGAAELQDLIAGLREQRFRRRAGMTIGQIQEVAAAVTERYRSAGFILAQAFVPAQEVDDGAVIIEVFEGKLGAVVFQGNEMYRDAVLAAPFEDLIDTPVTAFGIESAILTASDYPGISVFGVFQPGTEVGETDLVIRVQDERLWQASLRTDNYGTRFTGQYRVFADLQINNPTGVGDRFYATTLRQFDPSNSRFWKLEYERPIGLFICRSAKARF